MIQMALEQIFDSAKERMKDIEYSVSISILEVYNEQIRDLLQNSMGNSH